MMYIFVLALAFVDETVNAIFDGIIVIMEEQ